MSEGGQETKSGKAASNPQIPCLGLDSPTPPGASGGSGDPLLRQGTSPHLQRREGSPAYFLQLESRPSVPKRPFMFLKPTNEDLREELNRSSSKLGPDCPTPHFCAPSSQTRRVETVLNAEDSEKGEGVISPWCPPRLQVLEHLTLPMDMLTCSH